MLKLNPLLQSANVVPNVEAARRLNAGKDKILHIVGMVARTTPSVHRGLIFLIFPVRYAVPWEIHPRMTRSRSMFNRLRLALIACTFAGCVCAADPTPRLITVRIPMNVAQMWSHDEHPPATYELERIWLQTVPGTTTSCLRERVLSRGSVESYEWTSAGLTLRIRRQMPVLEFPMLWVFNRNSNEVSLAHPFLWGNNIDSIYHGLMSAPACSMEF